MFREKLYPLFLSLIFATLVLYAVPVQAEGIPVGNSAGYSSPPQNFCSGTIDWVVAPELALQEQDPCPNTAGSYDLYQNDQKTTYATYAALKAAYNKLGAAIWFVPAPKVVTPPADWCKGMRGSAKLWAVASNEVLPTTNPCAGSKGTFLASINSVNYTSTKWEDVLAWPYKGIGGSFYFEADLSALYLPLISRSYDVATLPAGWCAGKSGSAVLWTVTAQQVLPATNPCKSAGTFMASINNQSYKAETWEAVTDWPYLGIGGSFYFELYETTDDVCKPEKPGC